MRSSRRIRWLARSLRIRRSRSCTAFIVLLAALAILSTSGAVQAQRPPLIAPTDANSVIGRLPRGYAELEPDAAVANPARDGLARIGALLGAASRTGDARLAARAHALLSRYPITTRDPRVMRLRAFSAQHGHDFARALSLLDALIAEHPRDASARLARAQIHLVQGRLDSARNDCRVLALGLDAESGLLCAAALSLRTGDYAKAATVLDHLLGRLPESDDRRGFSLLARAEVAGRAGDADADAWYRRALATSPGDVRILVSYARYLRRQQRDREVEPLLRDAVQSDSAQLQRTLAAHAAGRSEARALVTSQARRYALAHAVGSQPEMRDEAEFLLTLNGRVDAALVLALRNFAEQRDYEDVDILIRAALAANRQQALAPLRVWAKEQGLEIDGPSGKGG